MHKRLTTKYGIQIPRTTKIGYGFYIGHGVGIVINGKTVFAHVIKHNHELCPVGNGIVCARRQASRCKELFQHLVRIPQ